MTSLLLFIAFLWAGMQNALAGGGSFITLPMLMWIGLDARSANVTSTLALFPAQLVSGWAGRQESSGAAGLSLRFLVALSFGGGILGALLLLLTPAGFFAHLIPWLVLFATLVFAWGSLHQRRQSVRRLGRPGTAAAQFCIAVYGGYFGGAIGFLMLAALSAAGQSLRVAGATKNLLAAVMNASAVAIFMLSPQVHWAVAADGAVAAVLGGILGALMLKKISERMLQLIVVLIGLALSLGLFVRAH